MTSSRWLRTLATASVLSALVALACSDSQEKPTLPLPTYSPTEFTGNRACGGIELQRVDIQIRSDGTVLAEAYAITNPERRSRVDLIWPPGYHAVSSGTAIEIKDDTGRVVVDGKGTFADMAICPYPDGTNLIWNLGNPVAP